MRDYGRTTDFATGQVTVAWGDAHGKWTRRAFVSRADAVAVVEISGPRLDLTVRLSVDLPGHPPDVAVSTGARITRDGGALLDAVGLYADDSHATGFIGVTRLVATGGTVTADGDRVYVTGADRVVLLTKMDRPHSTPDPGELQKTLADLPADYDALLARHVPIHGKLYATAGLELDVSDGEHGLPVGELLARGRLHGDRLDPALVEALFHSGRYFLLSSGGVLPPRLTGLWLADWAAAWSGDFTTDANINLQMATAALTGMPEIIAGYTSLIADQIEDWRNNARAVYGARGILAPSRTDGEHGLLFHLDDLWPWQMWVAGADWMLFPLHEYWQTRCRRSRGRHAPPCCDAVTRTCPRTAACTGPCARLG